MLAPGHVLVGLTLYQWAVPFFTGQPPHPAGYVVVALGSLLPDIDHPKSWVGRRTQPLSGLLARTFGHRGMTHSLIATMLFTVLAFTAHEILLSPGTQATGYLEVATSFLGKMLAALSLGYLSHLVADFFTKSGLPLLWPHRRNFRAPYTFTTGKDVEKLVCILLTAALAYHWIY